MPLHLKKVMFKRKINYNGLVTRSGLIIRKKSHLLSQNLTCFNFSFNISCYYYDNISLLLLLYQLKYNFLYVNIRSFWSKSFRCCIWIVTNKVYVRFFANQCLFKFGNSRAKQNFYTLQKKTPRKNTSKVVKKIPD